MPGPYSTDPAAQPLGAIGATPARVLARRAVKVLKPRGVVGRRRRRR